VQLDGSFHAWYEDRGPERCLMMLVDDATSQSGGAFSGQRNDLGGRRGVAPVD
jgi:hypothetical protein